MPHHSAQKRQMTSFVGSAHPPPIMTASASFPARGPYPRAELEYRMMPHTQGGIPATSHHPRHLSPHQFQHQHPPMRPHPPVSMVAPWTPSTSSNVGSGSGVVHRVDLHADENAHDETTTGSRGSNEETAAGTPRLLPSYDEGSRSFDSPHEVAASVLLLAATAMKERDSSAAENKGASSAPSTDTPSTMAESSEEPNPKKRKQAAGIMRKKSNDASMASHVSPYSHGSKNPDGEAGASGTDATTPLTDRGGTGSSPTSSYDLKDGQALHDSAKITDTKDISLPSHVEIPHFPSVLHAVLTESEFAGKVLMWLPHGQAWKIVRWDALRKQVLPKYFSQLREEDTKDASGSIDAFLWHLAAWGFEEVNDGPDVGAYSHILFRKELPGLCREMRFSPSESETVDSTPEKERGDGARYILQVPSLASTGVASDHSGRTAPDEEKKEDYASYPNQVTPVWPKRSHVSLGYPLDAHPASGIGAWKYYPEPSQWVGGSGTTATSSPSSVQSQRTMPPYSPIRVRSGRGACRLPLNRSRSAQETTTQPQGQQQPASNRSFPVSNRGKGGRVAHRRFSQPASDTSVASSTTTEVAKVTNAPPAPRPILKRKLPLMRKSSSSSDECSSSSSIEDSRKAPIVKEEEEKKEDDSLAQMRDSPEPATRSETAAV